MSALVTIKSRIPEADHAALEAWAREERWSMAELLRAIIEVALEGRAVSQERNST